MYISVEYIVTIYIIFIVYILYIDRYGFGEGKPHHPSLAFHMWRGEVIAFAHALAILDAIYMIEKDFKAGKTHEEMFKGK